MSGPTPEQWEWLRRYNPEKYQELHAAYYRALAWKWVGIVIIAMVVIGAFYRNFIGVEGQ